MRFERAASFLSRLVSAAGLLTAGSAALWDDNPADLDLLGFSTVATPIVAALTAPAWIR